MGLETATYPYDLNTANPAGTDAASTSDDHHRLVKTVLKNAIPGFVGVVMGTATESGSANAYALTLSPVPSDYAHLVGALLLFKATHANTGAATLNVNALGTKPIVDVNGGALASGDIANGSMVAVYYDGTSMCLISGNDRAPIDSPAFTGTPTAPTPSAADNSTKIATTAYVDAADALKANLASPAFTGAPTAPTAAVGTNTDQIATMAAIQAQAFASALPTQTGNAGKIVTTDGATASWVFAAGSAASLFGDGSDGDVTVSGSVTLARDMFYRNLALSAGAAIDAHGYRIFVSGTLDMTAAPAGAIFNSAGAGGAGVDSTGGSATGGSAGSAAPGNTVGAGAAGAAGGDGSTVNGTAGSAGAGSGNGGAGGTGGAGGAVSSNTGGAGGAGGALTATLLHNARTSLTITDQSTTLSTGGSGGGAGGGGAGPGSTTSGGGGGGSGSGGGIVQIVARYINRGASTAAAAIKAIGGVGGKGGAGNVSGNTAGGGGGSGGGGGWVVIIADTLLGVAASTAVDVSGGKGGNGGAGHGTGLGASAGPYGGHGRFTLIQTSVPSITDTGVGAAGSPVAGSGTTGGVAASAPVSQYSL